MVVVARAGGERGGSEHEKVSVDFDHFEGWETHLWPTRLFETSRSNAGENESARVVESGSFGRGEVAPSLEDEALGGHCERGRGCESVTVLL